MKLNQLSAVKQRVIACGLLVLAVGLIVTGVAVPTVMSHQYYDESIADSNDKLMRYLRVTARRPAIDTALKEVRDRDPLTRYFINATSAPLAAAELQAAVSKIVTDNRGRIANSQVLQSEVGKPVVTDRVAVQFQLIAATIPLQTILAAVENHEPSYFVDKLVVTSNYGRGFRAEPGIQPEFQIQLTIAAHFRSISPTASSKP
jgi:hypothetical protein